MALKCVRTTKVIFCFSPSKISNKEISFDKMSDSDLMNKKLEFIYLML